MARQGSSRRLTSLRLLFVLVLLALGAPLVAAPVGSAGHAASATTGSSKTVNGNWHPYNPLIHYDPDYQSWTGEEDQSKTPSVTVDRTQNLVDQVVTVSWKNFTPTSMLGSYADADRNLGPTPYRTDTDLSALYSVEVYECRGIHPTLNPYLNVGYKGKSECYEASVFASTDGAYGPNNEEPAVTQANGEGRVSFHVENSTSNNLLRCSPTQRCSIVVVPNQGGPPNGSDLPCTDHYNDIQAGPNYDQLGSAFAQFNSNDCNWNKRITVPLSFAPLANNCPDASSSFNAAGSPPMQRGLNQLLAGWCRGSNAVNFGYNFSTTESDARTRFLLSSSTGLTSDTDVALTSEPADPSLTGRRPFAYAPIANNAVSIPYSIDNVKTGLPINDLRLSARLVAKLLTQSYAPLQWNCPFLESGGNRAPYCASDIRYNPLSIFDDPEFQRLNFRGNHPDRDSFPSVTGAHSTTGSQQGLGSFFPTIAAGESDLTYSLTRWIASDPDASDFMRGHADQWGTRVNPNYLVKGGSLYPTTHIDALDPGFLAPNVAAPKTGLDLRTRQGFQGSWNPLGSPSQITATLLRGRSTATSVAGYCPADLTGPGNCDVLRTKRSLTVQFSKLPPEPTGTRDLTAVTDNTDAQANGLPTAELLTRRGTFVSPTVGSMSKAASTLSTNSDGVTQQVDFDSAPSDAYPLLLPVYAMVPTCGLTATKSTGIKSFLSHVVSSQSYGDAPGKLARGLVELTSAQLADTRSAIGKVSTTRCPAPPSNKTENTSQRRDGGGGGGGTTPNTTPTTAPSPASSPASVAPTPAANTPKKQKNAGYRLHDDGGALALLPVLLIVGALLLIGGPLAWWGAGTGPGQVAVARAKHLAKEGAVDLRQLLPARWRS